MKEVDFSYADLTESALDEYDLFRATFDRTNIGKANFKTASNFSIDPTKNKVKKALFSTENIRGLLDCFNVVIDS